MNRYNLSFLLHLNTRVPKCAATYDRFFVDDNLGESSRKKVQKTCSAAGVEIKDVVDRVVPLVILISARELHILSPALCS